MLDFFYKVNIFTFKIIIETIFLVGAQKVATLGTYTLHFFLNYFIFKA